MAKVAVYTEETARRLLNFMQVMESSGLLKPGVLEEVVRSTGAQNKDAEIYIKDQSGEEIPPYACLQVVGAENIVVGSTSYLLVDKPADTTGEAGSFIFNGHSKIQPLGRGIAQKGRVNLRATYTTGTPVAGEKWSPVVGSFNVTQDDAGPFTAHGEDDLGVNKGLQIIKLGIDGSGGGGMDRISFQINESGVSDASASGQFGAYKSASVTILSASCGQYSLVGTTVTVYDIIGCYFDEASNAAMDSRKGHAEWSVIDNSGSASDCFWEVTGLCCPS